MEVIRTRRVQLLSCAVVAFVAAAALAAGQRPNPGGQRQRAARETQAANTTYTRAEAETVAARLYRAILGREGEAAGLSGAAAEIQNGDLQGQIVTMVRSSEFRQRSSSRNSTQLLEQFYQGMLGRKPDNAGTSAFSARMEAGQYAAVLLEMADSAEFRQAVSGAAPAQTGRTAPATPTRLEAALNCQARVIDLLRQDSPGRVFLSFDRLPDVSSDGRTVQGPAVDRFDNDRQMNYSCQGDTASYTYADRRAARGGNRQLQFPSVAVKNCQVAVSTEIVFDAASLSATDSTTEYVIGILAKGGTTRYTCETSRQRVLSLKSQAMTGAR